MSLRLLQSEIPHAIPGRPGAMEYVQTSPFLKFHAVFMSHLYEF